MATDLTKQADLSLSRVAKNKASMLRKRAEQNNVREAQGFDIGRRCEDYLSVVESREVSRDLYEGFANYQDGKVNYLHKSTNEDSLIYNTRIDLSYYDNLIRLVIKARQALLWRKSPTIILNRDIERYREDVDGQGTDDTLFFQGVSENAEVDGMAWILVDKTSAPEGVEIQTRAQEEQYGIRPFMKEIPAKNVICWEFNPFDNRLDYVVVETWQHQYREVGQPRVSVKEWKVWYRNTWEVYRMADDESVDAVTGAPKYQVVKSGIHNLGEVPLIPVYGKMIRPYLGEPVSAPILDHIRAVFNKTSQIDFSIWKTINPIPCVVSESNPEDVNVTGQKGIWIPLPKNPNTKGNTEIFFLEMKGSGLEVAIKERDNLIKRIYEFALSSTKRDSKLIESDRTLRQQDTIQRSDLMACATNLEESIHNAWNLFEKATGVLRITKKTVSFNKDFDDSIIEAAMLREFREAVRDKLMTKEQFIKILQGGKVYNDPDFDIGSELKALEELEETSQGNTSEEPELS